MVPLIAQLSWCIVGAAVAVFFWQGGRIDVASGFFAASALYAALSVLAFKGERWAWWLTLLPPAIIAVCVGPWAIYNFYAFATDHPRYLDSPATIFVVAINCLVLLVPALIILVLMFIWRKQTRTPVERI
jgi:carbon starvation protein CstA